MIREIPKQARSWRYYSATRDYGSVACVKLAAVRGIEWLNELTTPYYCSGENDELQRAIQEMLAAAVWVFGGLEWRRCHSFIIRAIKL